ncbi:Bromodomain containing protein [Trichomonas vaginalis G3]|uniref:Bromodomain containing protein n=1 Tax=Trichomonas vaginalis (strain ATCC PRA-98 / G3) TaxID=412133 RepID=A2DA87_TRIV3|nr:acetylation-dependent protein binding [Trichomonas vaginalis G3]EAY22735.1 Bromodomain containing protein [Trichomonas vaginalis G3]KAI5525546.1 acetylation-dependent protein binding [Trichomonas vaginalis G3]|eukprot:XP_001583721.1 Bromodomain containing protein [Trichomonas vaginalis G3]
MSKLSPEQQQLCIEITAALKASPGAEMFNEPVDPKKQGAPNYLKKIRNPQDLGTIMHRIEASQYESVTQWEQDINTVWSNAVSYNGEGSFVGNLAEHMAKHFKKLKRRLDYFSLAGWTKHIYNLRQDFEKLLAQAPPSLGPITSKLNKHPSLIIEPLTSQEISQIIKASQIINEPQDLEAISQILKKNEPKANLEQETLILDVNNLSPITLHEMRNYYKKQCIERSIAYPQ